MTQQDIAKLDEILRAPRFKHSTLLEEWRRTATISEEPPKKGTRTSAQNSALHLDCSLIAQKLNDAGKDMRVVLKPAYNIPWTLESVKEHLFRPVMHAMYGIESTTELQKVGQIEHIHETIMRELGEKHGIEWHDFPSDDAKHREGMSGYKSDSKDHLSEYYENDDITPRI